MLDTPSYFGLASKVKQKGQWVDVDCTTNNNGKKWSKNECSIEIMLREGEHRDTDVAKYEIFGHEIQQTEKLFGHNTGLFWQIIVCIMSLAYSTRQHSYNASQI